MHASLDAHATAESSAPNDGAGLGVGWTDQTEPFHTSASGLRVVFVAVCPTATQALVVVHAIPDRYAAVSGGKPGVV
jgi:hypothetical protein